jgi:protein-tyrosine phosphatase
VSSRVTDPGRFKILVVCTGNICRSPVAEQLLRSGLTTADEVVTVVSAGTGARRDMPMTEQARALALRYGAESTEHRSSPLTTADVAGADLILTAARSHRAEVASLLPRASSRTFTLRQFARLVELGGQKSPLGEQTASEDDTARRLVAVVSAAAANRGRTPLLDARDDDIIDPYRQPQEIYDEAGERIKDAVDTIVAGFHRALAAS